MCVRITDGQMENPIHLMINHQAKNDTSNKFDPKAREVKVCFNRRIIRSRRIYPPVVLGNHSPCLLPRPC